MSPILNNSQFEKIKSNYILHYVDKTKLIASKKNVLYESTDGGETWKVWLKLPVPFFIGLKIQTKLGRRLFRQYVYQILIGSNEVFVFAFKQIFVFDIHSKELIKVTPIVGSRPLVVSMNKAGVFYGEYTSNSERKPIRLFRWNSNTEEFEVYHTFNNIRHIHSVQWDYFSEKLFIATGDEDQECFIGYFDDKEFVPLVQGSQQARGIQLLFTENYIYYATDAPDERNFIYRIKRNTKKIEKLQEIGGPVFYGSHIRDFLFFSTVCEPSEVNNQENVELWFSSNGENWKCIGIFKKDLYHMKLFQYGQLLFPYGEGDNKNLWLTTFAAVPDQTILRLDLKNVIGIKM